MAATAAGYSTGASLMRHATAGQAGGADARALEPAAVICYIQRLADGSCAAIGRAVVAELVDAQR